MKDRSPTYAGRVKLTPVAGTTDKFDMEMADEPSEVGTPLNKATLLTDATAAKYGPFRTQLSSLAVGDTISLKVNGVDTDFLVVHQGKPSSMYDDSCNGTWLLMKDIYETRTWDSTNNDYKNSDIYAYLNSTFFGLFNSNTQGVIKQVKIPYVNGTGGSAVASGANGLSTNVFLLGVYEVGFTHTSYANNYPIDGAKLDYFPTESGTAATRIATLNGTATKWLLRSATTAAGGETNVGAVSDTGTATGNAITTASGIRPAIILNSSAWFDPNDGNFYDSNLDPTPNDIFNAAFDKVPVIKLDGVWTEKDATNKSTPTSLGVAVRDNGGARTNNYAVFAGGMYWTGSSTTYRAEVYAYNSSLTQSSAGSLRTGRTGLKGASTGGYAIFGGGNTNNADCTEVDAYNDSLTRTNVTGASRPRAFCGATNVGVYALFGGGVKRDNTAANNGVDAYNTSLTRTVASSLGASVGYLAATRVNNTYALFGGGRNPSSSATTVVTAYDESLTVSYPTALSSAVYSNAGASTGTYALFAGGWVDGIGAKNTVEAYNSALTKSTSTLYSVSYQFCGSENETGVAIFAGGRSDVSTFSASATKFDSSLTKSSVSNLSVARDYLAGASVGNSIVFAGGGLASSTSNAVDAYTIVLYGLSITIPKWSKYKIDGVTTGEVFTKTDTAVNATANAPFTGYIKRGFTLSGNIL